VASMTYFRSMTVPGGQMSRASKGFMRVVDR
jgi:hypothetical protein